jgi:hypothetical protein
MLAKVTHSNRNRSQTKIVFDRAVIVKTSIHISSPYIMGVRVGRAKFFETHGINNMNEEKVRN